MTQTTLKGEPLTDNAKKNLARFKTMFIERQQNSLIEEQHQVKLTRNGVKVYTEEEKKAFLAERSDLVK